MADKQRETEKFVGCLLSLKTKMGQFGVQHIIGTVREIDVSSSEPAIVLDQAMCNGALLPDGFVLLSSQIADLSVIERETENSNPACSSANIVDPVVDSDIGEFRDSPQSSSVYQTNHQQKGNNLGFRNGDEPVRSGGNHQHSNGSTALMNSITSAMAGLTAKNQSHSENNESNSHMIAKPKPRKPEGNKNAYSSASPSSSLAGRVEQMQQTSNHSLENNKTSTNIGLSTSKTATTNNNHDGENILMRTFGGVCNNSSGVGVTGSLNGQALFNAVTAGSSPASYKMSNVVPGANKFKHNTNNTAPSPSRAAVTYDHKKLGVLSQFVSGETTSDEVQHATPRTPKAKTLNSTPNDSKILKSHGKGNGRQQQHRHGETFDTMSNSEMSVEFDFEGSNAQFEKLPVSAGGKPTKVTKQPQFCSTDTTYLADRVVESITVMETVISSKKFVTDTGVAIPSVDLSTRSKILNLAHKAGLTHSRVVEVLGRAVAQQAIPLLGDSYRLSPERSEDRPWVLICAGPHWQGAIGIAAARILASLGVHTCVHSPKEELQLCSPEETLYSMSGETLTRQISDLQGYKFELVIMARDDHLSRSVTLSPYANWLKDTPVMFVDPPLISSYRHQLDILSGGTQKGRKIVIISPVLPIAYPSDSTVKIFLVNLGIPNDIFEENGVLYKSPFGDKLVVQIFSGSPK